MAFTQACCEISVPYFEGFNRFVVWPAPSSVSLCQVFWCTPHLYYAFQFRFVSHFGKKKLTNLPAPQKYKDWSRIKSGSNCLTRQT